MNRIFTGERLETHIFSFTAVEHLHRYAIALEYADDKTILDVACGEGYGCSLLADKAKKIVGVDISEETINHAKIKYQKENIEFCQGDITNIPYQDNTFDLVISFETIEHHDKHQEMITEIKRVLKPGGILILSSPDKLNYSDIPKYKNPFHVKELYEDEFKDLIKSNFTNSVFISQRSGALSCAYEEKSLFENFQAYQGGYNKINLNPDWGCMYWIAIASDSAFLKKKFANFFIGEEFVFHQIAKEVSGRIKNIYENSITYKVGKFILAPFKWMKKIK